MKQIKRFIKFTFILYVTIGLLYWLRARPLYKDWGATAEETNMRLPGDELISYDRIVSTRAITIHATKEKVWPWIAQTGENHGGFNSYYWLENLFGAEMANAEVLHPEWQNPKVGDTVYYGKNEGYTLVSLVEPNEYYSLGGWTFYLQDVDGRNTRLIVRYPSMKIKESKFMTMYYYGLFESLHFIMESGMMMGVKQKAEGSLIQYK